MGVSCHTIAFTTSNNLIFPNKNPLTFPKPPTAVTPTLSIKKPKISSLTMSVMEADVIFMLLVMRGATPILSDGEIRQGSGSGIVSEGLTNSFRYIFTYYRKIHKKKMSLPRASLDLQWPSPNGIAPCLWVKLPETINSRRLKNYPLHLLSTPISKKALTHLKSSGSTSTAKITDKIISH